MVRGDDTGQRAGRRGANGRIAVAATSGASREAARRVQLDIRGQIAREVDRGTSGFALFQRELAGGRINLAQVVDASIGLRGGTGLHEVRNRDRSQQTDDGYNDHDFNQGETRLTEVLCHFHVVLSNTSDVDFARAGYL